MTLTSNLLIHGELGSYEAGNSIAQFLNISGNR
jgi:hypothetical protein